MNKFGKYYMDIAIRTAELSSCERLKVGAIIVKDQRIISIGYNGTLPGHDNCCEERVYIQNGAGAWLDPISIKEAYPHTDENGEPYKLVTKQEVLHAEENAIGKLAKSHESGEDATMYLSHAPCIECSKTIIVSGITTVHYHTKYRSLAGIRFLTKAGINVTHIK